MAGSWPELKGCRT